MADLIAANHTLILVVPRFGIPLGFGEKSVEEVCRQNGQDVDFFLMVCNLYTFDDYRLEGDEWLERVNMEGIVPYLEASHRYYLNERLPHIERHLSHIAEHAGHQYVSVLGNFIEGYRKDVMVHFDYEERDVFPYILQLQHSQGTASTKPIATTFLESHTDLVEKLSDLPQILYKYLPGSPVVEELNELVFSILQLSSDLEKHALIEEQVLMPYVSWMERRLCGEA